MLIAFLWRLGPRSRRSFRYRSFDGLSCHQPGGADSVAIIAASTNVDVGFVMAQQVARFMLVLSLARLCLDSLRTDS